MRISDLPQGVSLASPYCYPNLTTEQTEQSATKAYHLEKSAKLDGQTSIGFPDEFPVDFSLLAIVRPAKGLSDNYSNILN